MKVSILISSYNRLNLFRRTLFSIASRPPTIPFEVVVCDDNSTEDVLSLLTEHKHLFPWKFIKFDVKLWEKETGLKKYYNSPSVTNNHAFKNSSGDLIFLMGNEVIATPGCFDKMIEDSKPLQMSPYWQVFSTTFDMPQEVYKNLDKYGAGLKQAHLNKSLSFPLQCSGLPTDVTNYLSLTPRTVWETIEGYDERYLGGVAGEDSDFVSRSKMLPNYRQIISGATTLHQNHGGRTPYSKGDESKITYEAWDAGVARNREIFHSLVPGEYKNRQEFPWGTYGITDIITNGKL